MLSFLLMTPHSFFIVDNVNASTTNLNNDLRLGNSVENEF